ncbi:hypothetical protein [Leptospira koniambonensis]|uniref:hypothetical protein n=1 Tax=Leptospira koniambonensis TaxID=2484950 RepID=UPI003EBB4A5F
MNVKRKLKIVFLSSLILATFLIDCNKEYKGDDPEYFKKVEETKSYLKAHVKEEYEIPETSLTKEVAVLRYLEAVQNGQIDKYIFTKDEYIDIFIANSTGENILANNMTLDQLRSFTDLRRMIAIEKLQNIFNKYKGRKFKIETLTWRPEVRKLNVLIGHRIGTLTISFGKEKVDLEEIKLVIEHKGKFKVCVIGT